MDGVLPVQTQNLEGFHYQKFTHNLFGSQGNHEDDYCCAFQTFSVYDSYSSWQFEQRAFPARSIAIDLDFAYS